MNLLCTGDLDFSNSTSTFTNGFFKLHIHLAILKYVFWSVIQRFNIIETKSMIVKFYQTLLLKKEAVQASRETEPQLDNRVLQSANGEPAWPNLLQREREPSTSQAVVIKYF